MYTQHQLPAHPRLLLKAVAGQLRSKEEESMTSLLHLGATVPQDTKPTGNNPASIASSLQHQSQPGQAAGVTVALFGGSNVPGRDIRAEKLVRAENAAERNVL